MSPRSSVACTSARLRISSTVVARKPCLATRKSIYWIIRYRGRSRLDQARIACPSHVPAALVAPLGLHEATEQHRAESEEVPQMSLCVLDQVVLVIAERRGALPVDPPPAGDAERPPASSSRIAGGSSRAPSSDRPADTCPLRRDAAGAGRPRVAVAASDREVPPITARARHGCLIQRVANSAVDETARRRNVPSRRRGTVRKHRRAFLFCVRTTRQAAAWAINSK